METFEDKEGQFLKENGKRQVSIVRKRDRNQWIGENGVSNSNMVEKRLKEKGTQKF